MHCSLMIFPFLLSLWLRSEVPPAFTYFHLCIYFYCFCGATTVSHLTLWQDWGSALQSVEGRRKLCKAHTGHAHASAVYKSTIPLQFWPPPTHISLTVFFVQTQRIGESTQFSIYTQAGSWSGRDSVYHVTFSRKKWKRVNLPKPDGLASVTVDSTHFTVSISDWVHVY